MRASMRSFFFYHMAVCLREQVDEGERIVQVAQPVDKRRVALANQVIQLVGRPARVEPL